MSTSLPPLVEPASALSREEVARYSRHLIIPDLGVDGQKRLKNARVLVIGAGGLGAPTLLYLAAAGVGTIGIVDFDVVDESNLQRQVIHGVADVGRSKAQSARDSIVAINPLIRVRLHELRLAPSNAVDLFKQYDLILMAPTTSPPGIWSTTPRCWLASRTCGVDLPLRGPGIGVLGGRPRRVGCQLPRPVSRAAAAGHGAVLC